MRVFVSHNTRDKAIYSTLCMALDAKKVPRWECTLIAGGDSLETQLRLAIEDCSICIFIATRQSIESPWCLAELGAFWGAQKRIIVFLADPTIEESALPPQLRGSLYVDDVNQLLRDLHNIGSSIEEAETRNQVEVRRIRFRHELYDVAAQIVVRSDTIRDTTWGRRAKPMSKREKTAYEAYRDAIKTALAENKNYHELLSAEGREEFLSQSVELKDSHPNYVCRVLNIDISKFSMIDMLIGGECDVILSHVAASDNDDYQYLHVRSSELVTFLRKFYSEAPGTSRKSFQDSFQAVARSEGKSE